MNKAKYFLFPELDNNGYGVIIKNSLNNVDCSIFPLILLNKHGFVYYMLDESYEEEKFKVSPRTILIDSVASLFYFKLFLMRDKLSANSYIALVSLDLDANLDSELFLIKNLGLNYKSKDVLSVVFLLLALNKVIHGVNLLSYAKSTYECIELNKWYKKIIYDYSLRHDLLSSSYSSNVGFLTKKANDLYREKDFSSSIY